MAALHGAMFTFVLCSQPAEPGSHRWEGAQGNLGWSGGTAQEYIIQPMSYHNGHRTRKSESSFIFLRYLGLHSAVICMEEVAPRVGEVKMKVLRVNRGGVTVTPDRTAPLQNYCNPLPSHTHTPGGCYYSAYFSIIHRGRRHCPDTGIAKINKDYRHFLLPVVVFTLTSKIHNLF